MPTTRPPRRPAESHAVPTVEGLDEALAAQLPTFELFFKTFGFKRIHGRIWGLLVLVGRPLSSREIGSALSLSQGATSTALSELGEWGAIQTEFDSARRCHLHQPVSNTLSIVATVIRRREQVVFQQFKLSSARTLAYVTERYGERDPRVLTLRSIISTCEIADAVMQMLVNAVASALDDSESILYKAVNTALKVGVAMPARAFLGRPRPGVERAVPGAEDGELEAGAAPAGGEGAAEAPRPAAGLARDPRERGTAESPGESRG